MASFPLSAHAGSLDPSIQRPEFGAAYETWLHQKHGVNDLNAHKNHYELVAMTILKKFQDCPFWKRILQDIPNIDTAYLIKNKYALIKDQHPIVYTKPWSSFLHKTYRKNVLNNNNWPECPDSGWCIPPVWFSQIDDIVRTSIVVKYIDGVPLVLESLKNIATACGCECEHELISRPDGYYGAHFILPMKTESSSIEWKNVGDYILDVETRIG